MRDGAARSGRPTHTRPSIWIWLNGHEWAKRQLAKADRLRRPGRRFPQLRRSRAVAAVLRPARPGAVTGFLWRWFHRLPPRSPMRTCALDTSMSSRSASSRSPIPGCSPGRCRARVLRGPDPRYLDLGLPVQVSAGLRPQGAAGRGTPPRARSAPGHHQRVDPQIVCYCRSSRLKQDFKEHRALRTDGDLRPPGLRVGRRLTYENWNALRDVGEHANQRLCDAGRQRRPAPDVATLNQVARRRSPASASTPRPWVRTPGSWCDGRLTGFCHLITGSTTPPWSSACAPCWMTTPSPLARPPTTSPGWRANRSSPDRGHPGYDGSDWPHHDGLKWPRPLR